MKKALITGITGQDGSYLAEFLLNKGYEIHGIIRRASTFNTQRIDHIYTDPHDPHARLFLHYGDLADQSTIMELMFNIKPDEVYHLGAQSHVRVSFDMPEYTGDIDALGTIRILEAIRSAGVKSKFYQASSSEMFGKAKPPQNEKTVFQPQSPYAISKLYAYWTTINYREAYGIYACNGILFNHESPRRGETFVTRKITKAIANILKGDQQTIYLGNLDAKRDWGFAPEYIEVMWHMLQQKKADDYIIGTGKSNTVRRFVEEAFKYVGVTINWTGKDAGEKGIVKTVDKKWGHILRPGKTIIEVDPKYFRPTEVDYLMADASKARKQLNWKPRIAFDELVRIMVDYDLKLVGLDPIGDGINISCQKKFNYTQHDISFCEKIKEGR